MANYTNGVMQDNGDIYEVIPTVATDTRVGGIKASNKAVTDTLEVKIGEDNKLYTKDYSEDISNLQAQIDALAGKATVPVGTSYCYSYGSTVTPIVGVATEYTEETYNGNS